MVDILPPWLTVPLPPTWYDWSIAVIAFAFLLAFLLIGHQNRKIEKIAIRYWSTLAIGGAGVLIAIKIFLDADSPSDAWYGKIMPAVLVYAVGSLATILVSLNRETREENFHSVFIYDTKSMQPLEAVDRNYFSGRPHLTSWDNLPSWLLHKNKSLSEASGGRLYLDVLLGMVLQLLFGRYRSSWAVNFEVIDLPHVRGMMFEWGPQPDAPVSLFRKWGECERWFPESCVFRAWVPHRVERMAVPIKTNIWGETKHGGGGQPLGYSLNLKNPFAKITISITEKGGGQGIGPLSELIGYTLPYSEEFSTVTYSITLRAQFNRFRSGHPQMVRWYSPWVDDMFGALQEELDSRRHWEKQKEHYTVFRREQSTPRDPQNMTQPTRG